MEQNAGLLTVELWLEIEVQEQDVGHTILLDQPFAAYRLRQLHVRNAQLADRVLERAPAAPIADDLEVCATAQCTGQLWHDQVKALPLADVPRIHHGERLAARLAR